MNDKPDVFFYEAFEEEAEQLRAHLPPGIRADFSWKTIQETGHAAPGAPVISTRTQSVIPAAWASSLKGILTRSTGFDHVLTFRRGGGGGVPAGYLPLYCHRAVAEQALIMGLALLRRLPLQIRQLPSFHRDGITGREFASKTAVVVGVGNIGSEIVKLCEGVGMKALGVDPVKRHGFVTYVEPGAGLARADLVFCSMNLTRENARYFDYDRLSACRPDAVFVNVARGEHSPLMDLHRLLKEERLGGVGLDVYENEPALAVALRNHADGRQPDLPPTAGLVMQLLAMGNTILTPHNAFNTTESVERKSRQSVESIAAFLQKDAFPWPVSDQI
jgi:D-lactate dehydrogenase